MVRYPRVDVAENYYHCMNRANARLAINFCEEDYLLFLKTIKEAQDIFGINILAFVLMPNHFHLIIFTKIDGQMGTFMKWLTLTYTQRWHKKHNTVGYGHLFQGRYKSVIIKDHLQLSNTIRYVERNPLTANLVSDILDWRYSSLYQTYVKEDDQYNIKIDVNSFNRDKNYLYDLVKQLSLKEIEKAKNYTTIN